MSEPESTTSGRRVVAWVFVGALALGIGFGAFVGLVISNDAAVPVGLFGVQFRPTPLNMASYGGGAVLALSGIFYVVMRYTKRFDDEIESV
ncbi:DUF7520 family protein [Halomicrobium katesii]|uniref:DUF7520 family protein n=1 Tax=Halomicrobium katesii TaxID=437163 RepID=UPI00037475AD|nr:hypothetical protein [Halomicrobium katesii]